MSIIQNRERSDSNTDTGTVSSIDELIYLSIYL